MVWFVHLPWLVQPAVFENSGDCFQLNTQMMVFVRLRQVSKKCYLLHLIRSYLCTFIFVPGLQNKVAEEPLNRFNKLQKSLKIQQQHRLEFVRDWPFNIMWGGGEHYFSQSVEKLDRNQEWGV